MRAIREIDPDVAGLQEVRPLQLRYLRRRLPEYRFLSKGRARLGRYGEHCPVLVRRSGYTVGDWDVRRLAAGRIATVAGLSAGTVINTHLDETSPAAREASAETLAAWAGVRAGPVIVIGDLNATPDDPPLRTLLAAGLRDALSLLPANGAGAATGHSWTGTHDGRRIDHILVSPEWDVVDATVVRTRPGGRLPSDHWPVMARLRSS